MKSRGLLLAFLALIIAAMACSAPLGGNASPRPTDTQAAVEPAQMPTLTLAVPTDVLPTATDVSPTEAPVLTQPPVLTASPTAAPTAPAAPVQAGPVVLAKIAIQPGSAGEMRIVDAVTGLTQATFQAPDMTFGANNLVGGKSVFYVGSDVKGIHRVGFDGQAQDLTSLLNPEGKIFDGLLLPSPDGSQVAWSRVLSSDSSGTHVQLLVANVDGSGQKTLIDETRTQPSRPEPVRWSNDGKSIYYTNIPYGIGGYILFFAAPDLNKLDIASGQSTQVLKNGCLCTAAISPDETKVAYVQKPESDQMSLFVRSLSGGEPVKAKLPAGHMQGGGIVWAPDSQSFLVTSAVGSPDAEAYSVMLYNAADLSAKTLIQDDPRLIQPILWPTAGVVWMNDAEHNAWRMDPASGTLTQSSTGEMVLSGSR